ncbi:hypothetical protein Tco_0604243 [Tanacetum coccineum]
MAAEVPQTLEYKGGQLNAAHMIKDFQDNPDDEEDTRNSQEYLNDLEEEFQERSLLAKSKRLFKTKDVSSNDNEMDEVKVLMALVDDENVDVGKESATNGEWVKISMRKVHTLLEMEDNDERKTCIVICVLILIMLKNKEIILC